MNKHIKVFVIALAILQLVLIDMSHAKSKEKAAVSSPGADKTIAAAKHKMIGDKQIKLEDDAVAVVLETPKAIIALEKKDAKSAKEILTSVSSKLSNLLAKNPSLSLIPADVDVDVKEYEGTNQTIANAVTAAKSLLDNGKLQEARKIILPLASEIRITTLSIPLGTFPAVIKQALSSIDAGKIDQAAVELDSGLSTFVIATDVMPLPVLRAEELLSAASNLEHTKDLNQKQIRTEIQKYTDAAQDNLKIAELLGYGSKKDYKTLYQGIDGIDKTLFSNESDNKWQKVKDMLAAFKDRLKALSETAERIGHPAK